MSAQPKRPFATPEEYLAIERAADFKSEYFAGEMVAMSGASDPHETIVVNLTIGLGNILRGKPCRVKGGNLRISVRGSNYLYPDLSVVCGEAQFADGTYLDTLVNPTAIFEILSESTEHKDRGLKWMLYQRIQSLQYYVLISQKRARVEIYTRQPNGDWLMHAEHGIGGSLIIPTMGVSISLSELYENVAFPPIDDELTFSE